MPLIIVAVLLRHQRDPGAPQHAATRISSFLSPPSCLALSQACAFGSTKLLDWIWDSSCTSAANRPAKWSLHNFIRFDPHYNRDQFAKSMEVAVHCGDLPIVKWLFAHFSGCQISVDVAISAARAGSLPILQFLLANDSGQEGWNTNSNKKRKVRTGGEGVKAEKLEPSQAVGGHVVHWGENVMMSALDAGHADVVRWLHEHMPDQKNEGDIEREIRYSLRNGDDAIAKILMPKGRCVLDYAVCSSVEMVELLLDCGYIQRDISLANSAIQDLAHLGRLDMMQQVVLLHSPRCDDSSLCLHVWSGAIRTGCENGYLAMLQWLFDHPLGQELRQNMKPNRKYSFFVCLAAQNDQAEIIQYLYEQGGVDEAVITGYAREFMIAIRDDRYNAVKWMAKNIPFPERGLPGARAIDITTRSRRFNILKLFHELGSSGVIDLSENEENRGDQVAA